MDCQKQIEELFHGDRRRGLNAVEFFRGYLSMETKIDPELIHQLVRAFTHPIWAVRSEMFSLVIQHQHLIYPHLSRYLESDSEDIQYWCLQVYSTLCLDYFKLHKKDKNPEMKKKNLGFVDANVAKLKSSYPKISKANQIVLISGLAKLGYEKLIPFFIEGLKAKQWIIRSESSKALVEIGKPAVSELKALIHKGTREQSFWSFSALGQILGDKALEAFIKVANSPETPEEIRIHALSGIKKVGSDKAIPYLIRSLSSELWALRAQAASALVDFGDQVVDHLFECLDSKDQNRRYWALQALEKVVTSKDLRRLEDCLGSRDKELRFYAIQALSKIASSEAITMISQCFCDQSWLIQKHACERLIEIGEASIKPIVQLLEEHGTDEDIVFWSLKVLSGIKVKAVLPALFQFLQSETRDFRIYAARAIAQVPGEDAIHLLISGFKNHYWAVRQECFKQLQSIEGVEPCLYALRYVHDSEEPIQFWSVRLLRESSFLGAGRLVEEFLGMEAEGARRLAVRMEDLQNKFLLEIFESSKADKDRVLGYLRDPFKVKDGGPVVPSALEQGQKPIQEIHGFGANYFHFEDPGFTKYEFPLEDILEKLVHLSGSDLHLKVGERPVVRVNGKILCLELPELSANQIRDLLRDAFPAHHRKTFCDHKQLDCSYNHPNGERFRVNLFLSHAGVEGAFRHIHSHIPTFSDLKLPEEAFENLSSLHSGLVLITGVTGAGKSSTLASIIGTINRRDQKHIICIEDPIEYIHSNHKSVISHRQIGEHVDSFIDGLRGCLREDPDIVLVGEMRDVETIKSVLKLAGTGHLVFSTFHTSSAPQTIEQIIQFFPPDERHNICAQLAFCLKAVVTQFLVPDAQMLSRIPVLEILTTTYAVKNVIREGKTDKLLNIMETSAADGMMTRDQYLKSLVQAGKIPEKCLETMGTS
jgi:twitching motility protein PilT